MRSVNVAELKNRLRQVPHIAKAGEEVVIRDRNLPVAKLVPFSAEGADDQELVLVAAGKLRLPQARLDVKALLKIPTGSVQETKRSEPFSPQRRRTVKKTTAFWDASALVPLCVQRSGESSRAVPAEKIRARGLVGKPHRSP